MLSKEGEIDMNEFKENEVLIGASEAAPGNPLPGQNENPAMQDTWSYADREIPGESNWEEETMKPKKKKKPRKTRKGGGRMLAAALCFSLLGSILGAGGVLLADHLLKEEKDIPAAQEEALEEENVTAVLRGIRETSVVEIAEIETGKELTAAEVYAANVNSTVGITTSITTNYWGYQTTAAASGSGFIITQDGYILTNYHVIENSNSITVSLYDGTVYEAELVGYDESLDTAVLKVDAEGLAPVILGDSENMNVGDGVVAIGNPLGELTFSLTEGAISAKDREITLSGSGTMDLMQTDCAINSGNSGGALFNMYGEVIGITNAKFSSGSSSEASIDNIGFAIPINNVMNIVESIIEKGYISKPYMGVSVTNVSAEAQAYGIPAGAAVQSVTEDSPAEKAGLEVGDVIMEANGTEISSSSDLVAVVRQMQVGDRMEILLYRQGETRTVTVVIEEQIRSALPDEEEEQQQEQTQMPQGYPWMPGFGG